MARDEREKKERKKERTKERKSTPTMMSCGISRIRMFPLLVVLASIIGVAARVVVLLDGWFMDLRAPAERTTPGVVGGFLSLP